MSTEPTSTEPTSTEPTSTEPGNRQLEVWKGELGDAYTRRNAVDWRQRLPAFRQMLAGLPITRALEIGCNRGHNLKALAAVLGEEGEIYGIEPNDYSRRLAREANPGCTVLPGQIDDLPFASSSFDLVMTAGVLIHIPLAGLDRALAEVHRVSRRHVLAIEYFAESETPIPYRGRQDLLFKRNFLHHYESRFPDLSLVRDGYWTAAEGFDRTHWWLFEKR